MMLRRTLGAAFLVALAACSGDAERPQETTPGASTPASTPATSAFPDVNDGSSPLEPGRYTRDGFEPRITFEVAEGWEGTQVGDGFFDIQQDVGSPDVIAVQFANVAGVVGAGGGVAPASAAEAAELLEANPGLTVLEASESRIGGLNGSQITVENAGDTHASVMDVPAGTLGIDPARRLWVAFVDSDAGVVAVMVGGSVERWDEALAAAEPVLESVTIGD